MHRPIILDGGMGRELKRMGAPFRQPEWSALALIEAPEFVARAHRAFIEAGADVITTNSYAVVPFHIGEARFAAEGQALADRAGRLARDAANAAGRPVVVAGSLPPLFGSYRPDLFDPERAPALLATLIGGLAPHVDLWLAETQSSIREAESVSAALQGDTRSLWVSFTLDDEPSDPARLRSGEPVADAVRAAVRLGAGAVLFNCSQPEVMAPAVDVARTVFAGSPRAIGVYANAFPPQRPDATANETLLEIRPDLTPERYAALARDWAARGATILGGCCGIGPEHIRALKPVARDMGVGHPEVSVTQNDEGLFEAVVTPVHGSDAIWRTERPLSAEQLVQRLLPMGFHVRDLMDHIAWAEMAADRARLFREMEPWARSASEADLVHAYEAAAVDVGREIASPKYDYRARHRAGARADLSYGELKRRGEKCVAALLPLLTHDDPGVRLVTAAHALWFAPTIAEPLLEGMSKRTSTGEERVRGMYAERAVSEWRRGRPWVW